MAATTMDRFQAENLFGLTEAYTRSEAKKAYRNFAMLVHPDRSELGTEQHHYAENTMMRANLALEAIESEFRRSGAAKLTPASKPSSSGVSGYEYDRAKAEAASERRARRSAEDAQHAAEAARRDAERKANRAESELADMRLVKNQSESDLAKERKNAKRMRVAVTVFGVACACMLPTAFSSATIPSTVRDFQMRTTHTEQWKEQDGRWYWYDANGEPRTGWQEEKGNWYYFDKKGRMVTGWKKSKGHWYYFNELGIMQKNTVVDGYKIDDNGIGH